MNDMAERFKRDTAEHQMTAVHDDGLYRHLTFRGPRNSLYWFDIVTAPGALVFMGDGESYVFRRMDDMFEFFRGSAWKGQPNIGYWAEKLTDDRDSVMRYDQDLLVKHIEKALTERYADEPMPDGLGDEIRDHVLDEMVGDETYDRRLVDDFRFYTNDEDRFSWPSKTPDFEFGETFEWNCRDYHWWFLWACHAIIWGIGQYDKAPTGVTV